MGPRVSFTAERLSTARAAWVIAAAIVLAGAAVIAAIAIGASSELSPLLIVPVAVLTALAAFATPRAAAFTRRERLEVRIDDAGIWLGRAAFLTAGEVSQGFVLPLPADGGFLVRIERWGLEPDERLVVGRLEDSQALIARLGIGVDRRTATLRGLARFHALRAATRGVALALPPAAQAVIFVLMLRAETAAQLRAAKLAELAFLPLALVFYLVIGATRTRIEVGADGVLVRWLGLDRFYRHADVVTARVVDALLLTGVELELASGRTVALPMGTRRVDAALSRELLARIDAAREHAARARNVGGRDALHRAGRPFTSWLAALRNVGAGANADMRTATVSLDGLAAILLDPASAPATRAAAAVAAIAADPLEGRSRIRVAQATCADGRLKRALGTIARIDADDALIARTLRRLDP